MNSPLTKGQLIGVLVMMVIITIFIGMFFLFNHLFTPVAQPLPQLDTLTIQQVAILEQSVQSKKYYKIQKKDTIPLYIHHFDPNTADSIELLQVGFTPWMIKNMLKYRAKNGVWKTKESLKKIYGMTDELYAQIEPYIVIVSSTDTMSDLPVLKYNEKKDTILNLNTCDTTELKYIHGIGIGYAQRIIRYRNQLGGYLSVNQLYEIDGIPIQTIDSIITHFIVDSNCIHTIDINHSSVERLQRHPYLSFTQAKAIYELRRMKFKLNSIDELAELDCLSEKDIQHIEPYLSFK